MSDDVGTTTGEQVCEVRVTGADAAWVPRVLAAATRYRAACVAERAAGVAFDADAAGGGESWVRAWRETVDAREALLAVARGER